MLGEIETRERAKLCPAPYFFCNLRPSAKSADATELFTATNFFNSGRFVLDKFGVRYYRNVTLEQYTNFSIFAGLLIMIFASPSSTTSVAVFHATSARCILLSLSLGLPLSP